MKHLVDDDDRMHPDVERDRQWNALCRLVPSRRAPLRTALGLVLVRAGLRLALVTADDVRAMRPTEPCMSAASR